MPWGGGNYQLGVDTSRTTTNSLITSFNPSVGARMQFAFSQPLLRDFNIDATRAQIDIETRNRTIADTRVQEEVVATTSDAERAYWLLVAANALVNVQQRALDLALELERTNQARVDVGQSPPLDLVAARAEVAQRRENLIVARTTARQAEDQLRTLILDQKRGFLERAAGAGRSGPAHGSRRRTSMPRSAAPWRSAPTCSARARKSRSPTRGSRSRRTRRGPTCGSRPTT